MTATPALSGTRTQPRTVLDPTSSTKTIAKIDTPKPDTSSPQTQRPSADAVRFGRLRALSDEGLQRLALQRRWGIGDLPAQSSPQSTYPWIGQLQPDGVKPSSNYTNAQSNCAPTCLAMIAQHFGIRPTGQPPNESQILDFMNRLGTTSGGTEAKNIPAACAAIGLQAEQWKVNDSAYSSWSKLAKLSPAQRDQALNDGLQQLKDHGGVLLDGRGKPIDLSKYDFTQKPPLTTAQLASQLNVTPDKMRDAIFKQDILDHVNAEVAQGRPVMINANYNALEGSGPGTGHYVVITGSKMVDGKLYYTVNDPWPAGGNAGVRDIPADQIAKAIADNASAAAVTGIWKP